MRQDRCMRALICAPGRGARRPWYRRGTKNGKNVPERVQLEHGGEQKPGKLFPFVISVNTVGNKNGLYCSRPRRELSGTDGQAFRIHNPSPTRHGTAVMPGADRASPVALHGESFSYPPLKIIFRCSCSEKPIFIGWQANAQDSPHTAAGARPYRRRCPKIVYTCCAIPACTAFHCRRCRPFSYTCCAAQPGLLPPTRSFAIFAGWIASLL